MIQCTIMRYNQDKDRLRKLFLSLRRLIPAEEKRKADGRITDRVMISPEWQNARTVCLYMSTSEEIDTKPLLATALTENKQVVFPRVEQDRLVLHCIQSIKDFTRGAYQILEPKKATTVVDPKSVDLFIVPGIAFDREGYRLGWGKGYYDRLLSESDAPKIGLAYAVQVIEELPRSSYDVGVDKVMTEK